MDNALLSLTHEQQQAAVEQIQELMTQGVSSDEAIQIIANRLREAHQNNTSENNS
ncbi:YoaH family protein [Actinobacillus pleuropneumoniae]|uniref:YoaH family protein n=1 Tax=Actinobacillus pleuropneumoniae TaxID=715 RepID=UPI003F7B9E13